MEPGISGLSLFVPRHRVRLESWAEWTGADPRKVEAVVGRSFRVCTPAQNVYTMAANAVLDLIERYDVDPRDIGYLALGTESSTDNAAGAVVVRGMLDEALTKMGRPPLHRACEVPEFKHACLGGVYGLKSAARYLACDGRGRRAIVVSADIAEYERGSTGEQTQGAGAVAMLLDTEPTLVELKLANSGSSSAYRGVDFRKPALRHREPSYAARTKRAHDFPIFNGTYSTHCYIEATVKAIEAMFERRGGARREYFDEVAAIVCHRPYQHMPLQAMAAGLLWTIGRESGIEGLSEICAQAEVDPALVAEEIGNPSDLFARFQDGGPQVDPFPGFSKAVRAFRRSPGFKAFTNDKMKYGHDVVSELGNLYTAALPAWLGSALADPQLQATAAAGDELLAVGYGSGDAAEAIPMNFCPDWQTAAANIGFADALQDAVDLDQAAYEALHDGEVVPSLETPAGFRIARIGQDYAPNFQDLGIEYYDYARPSAHA